MDVDYLLSQKKKLLRKQELKLKQLQKENKLPKQAGPSHPSQPLTLILQPFSSLPDAPRDPAFLPWQVRALGGV